MSKNRIRTVEEIHADVLQRLYEAKQDMSILTSGGDWTAKAQIDCEFNYLEKSCKDFGNYQLNIPYKQQHKPQ